MITISCLQLEPVIGDVAANLGMIEDAVRTAAQQGATLLVLPELCNSGYVFESRAEATSLAEVIPGGRTSALLTDLAAELGVYVVCGICEIDGDDLYNSIAMVGPKGHIGTYRKLHLWNEENLYFERGNLGVPVFHTPIGRIACCICYDIWFPEVFRLAALQGADIMCVATNWVPIPGQDKNREAMANIVAMGQAHMNSIFVACANRVGTERGQPFIGQSLIVNYTGWPIGKPASADNAEIIHAEVDLSEARRKRNWNAFNQPLRDRRTDLYGEMLGSDATPDWY
ncbi:nitrilase family protein [Paracoccus sp. P2]|uniref:nitrilase family protein n=1 Tax=Paracoccus sp. P2 TaxID=3248840 RepID=UPI00391F7121